MATGCFCFVGTRGTGMNGVDECTTGNDCVTALCMEGPPATGKFFCSGPCMQMSDCTGQLPQCLGIFGVGDVCARTPPPPP